MSYVTSVIKHAHEQILLFHVHIQYINLWLQALAHTFNEWELYRWLQVRDKTYGEAKNGTCMCRTKQPAHKHPQLAREFGLVEHCRVCAHSDNAALETTWLLTIWRQKPRKTRTSYDLPLSTCLVLQTFVSGDSTAVGLILCTCYNVWRQVNPLLRACGAPGYNVCWALLWDGRQSGTEFET